MPATVGEELLVEEFKALRQEIDLHLKAVAAIEQNTLIALAVVYAWLIVSGGARLSMDQIWPRSLLYLPTVVGVVGGWRCIAHYMRLTQIGAYIKEMELAIKPLGVGPGWESYLARPRHGVKSYPFLIFGVGYWVLVVVISFVVSLVLYNHPEIFGPVCV